MNYRLHYDKLIERAKNRSLAGYTELHHIIPRCVGGSDEPKNLVALTAEEHFVAHQLLLKINPFELGLILAANMMCISPFGGRINNKRYSWLKKALSRATSERFKGRVWTEEQNAARSKVVAAQWADPEFKSKRSAAMRGRRWSEESRAARSAAMKGKPGRVWTPEQRAKLSASKRKGGVVLTDC